MPDTFPPGPRDWFFGFPQMSAMQADLLGYYARLHADYGDSVGMRFGPYLYYAFFHPDQVHEVLVSKAKHFIRLPRAMDIMSQWNGQSLLITEGETWRKQRRMTQPAFSPRRFGGYAEAMLAEIEKQADGWEAELARGPLEIDMDRATTDLTMRIIARTIFGAELGDRTAAIAKAVATLSEVAFYELSSPWVLPDWIPWPGKPDKWGAIRLLDETIRGFIRERRASGDDRGDLLSMLIKAVDEEGDGGSMTDEQVRDQSMTFFLAGHDTTASGLTWVWYNLATHPEIADRIVEEVERVVGDRGVTYADLEQLTFTEQCVKETLRIYPPATLVFMRQTIDEVQIGDYTLAPGSLVNLCQFITQRDPRWFPEPEKFDPDRWGPGRVDQIPQYAYFAFGGGPRVCIGQSFALTEMLLAVATQIRRFRISLAPGEKKPELLVHLSLRPKNGLKLRLEKRA